MTAPVLPPMAGALSDLLLADPAFTALIPGGLATSAPDDVTRPYAVHSVSAAPLSGKGVAYRGTFAVHGCATKWNGTTAPDTIAWNIVAAAAAVLNRAANVPWRNTFYTTEVQLGPLPMDPDKSRGDATPVYWALIRGELRIRVR
jgi:hypothetical protein